MMFWDTRRLRQPPNEVFRSQCCLKCKLGLFAVARGFYGYGYLVGLLAPHRRQPRENLPGSESSLTYARLLCPS